MFPKVPYRFQLTFRAVIDVTIESGKFTVGSLQRKNEIEGVKCGLWGCGILEIGNFNTKAKTTTLWVEELLPPPPPATKFKLPAEPLIKNDFGVALVEFHYDTGNASVIRPFSLNYDNQTGPEAMLGGCSCFDEDGGYFFACYPDMDDTDTEGICYATTAASKTDSPVQPKKWGNKKFTITDIQYATPLKSVAVLAQEMGDDTKMTATKIFQATHVTVKRNARFWSSSGTLGLPCTRQQCQQMGGT